MPSYLETIMTEFLKNSVNFILVLMKRNPINPKPNSFEKIGAVTKMTIKGPTPDRPRKHYVCHVFTIKNESENSTSPETFEEIIDETIITGQPDSKVDAFIYPTNTKRVQKLAKIFTKIEETLSGLLKHQKSNTHLGFYPVNDTTINDITPKGKKKTPTKQTDKKSTDKASTSKDPPLFSNGSSDSDSEKPKSSLNKNTTDKTKKKKEKKKVKRKDSESLSESLSESSDEDSDKNGGPSSKKRKPNTSLLAKERKADEEAARGILPEESLQLWETMNDKDKKRFLNPNKMIGISQPIHGKTKKGKPLNSARVMCCLYKSQMPKCLSRVMDDETRMYVSGEAKYLHASNFGDMELRKQSLDEAYRKLRVRSLCHACRHHFENGRNKYISIVSRTQTCYICKKNASSTFKNHTTNEVGVCTHCMKKHHKDQIYEGLSILSSIFPDFNITLQREEIVLSEDSCVRNDYTLRYTIGNMTGIVIVECDEEQHQNNARSSDKPPSAKSQSEKAKTIDEIAGTFIKAFTRHNLVVFDKNKNKDKDADNIKCLFIRINPYGKYVMVPGKTAGEKVTECYGTAARVVIMRQWIIWHMTHIQEVRSFLSFFMFYDVTSANIYPHPSKYAGSAFVFRAPKPKTGLNWCYSLDFSESITESQEKQAIERKKMDLLGYVIMKNQVAVERVFKNNTWHIDSQNDNIFPREIENRIQELRYKIRT